MVAIIGILGGGGDSGVQSVCEEVTYDGGVWAFEQDVRGFGDLLRNRPRELGRRATAKSSLQGRLMVRRKNADVKLAAVVPGGSEIWSTSVTWTALNFAIPDPYNYRPQYVSSGTGTEAEFTARAWGDLDCDGLRSEFARRGNIDANTGDVTGAKQAYVNRSRLSLDRKGGSRSAFTRRRWSPVLLTIPAHRVRAKAPYPAPVGGPCPGGLGYNATLGFLYVPGRCG